MAPSAKTICCWPENPRDFFNLSIQTFGIGRGTQMLPTELSFGQTCAAALSLLCRRTCLDTPALTHLP